MAASGLAADKVKIHTTYLGGGFGRRGEADFVTDAVETSKAVGKPVKVVWTREDDMQHDYYRPVSYARMWGALDASGKPTVFMQRLVQQSLMKRIGGLPPNGVDFISLDGAANLPYDIPNVRVEYTETDPGIPFGFWRSVGASFQGFVVEAFIDELATTAGEGSLSVPARPARQGAAPPRGAGARGGEGRLGQRRCRAGRGRGIAVMECFGSILAQVTEVSVDAQGAVKVHKIVCTVDTGWVINPDTIKAQMEGGIVYGLTAALKGEITIENGRVVQRHFGDYQMMRHNEMPRDRGPHRAEHRGAGRHRRAEHGAGRRLAGERDLRRDRQADLQSASAAAAAAQLDGLTRRLTFSVSCGNGEGCRRRPYDVATNARADLRRARPTPQRSARPRRAAAGQVGRRLWLIGDSRRRGCRRTCESTLPRRSHQRLRRRPSVPGAATGQASSWVYVGSSPSGATH